MNQQRDGAELEHFRELREADAEQDGRKKIEHPFIA